MYVCICRAVTENQIRQALDQGLCSRRQLIKCLGVGRDCGKCHREVKAMLLTHSQQSEKGAIPLRNEEKSCTLSAVI